MANFTSIINMFKRFMDWLKEIMDKIPTTPEPVPTPTPTPTPTPVPVPPTPEPIPVPIPPIPVPPVASIVFTQSGNTIMLDMNTLPGSMGRAGFSASDNALYYAMAHVYAFGPGRVMPDDSEGSLVGLNQVRQQIFDWFDKEVLNVRSMMIANQSLNLVAIVNDGRDRCGFRLGPAILERLNEFGSRIQLGHVLSPDEY